MEIVKIEQNELIKKALVGHQWTIAHKNIVFQPLTLEKSLGEMLPLLPEVLHFTK